MPNAPRGWQRPFDDPIPLPRGRQLVTLKDAATYITKLPEAEQNPPAWQGRSENQIPGWHPQFHLFNVATFPKIFNVATFPKKSA